MSEKNVPQVSPITQEQHNELSELLKKTPISSGSAGRRAAIGRPNPWNFMDDEDEDDLDANPGKLSQWTTSDGKIFIPASRSVKELPPGYYVPKFSPGRGFYALKLELKTEGLLKFPDTNCDKVIDEINRFWTKEHLYRKHQIAFKRGILLWGPPGSGKTSTILLAIKDVIDRGGVALQYSETNCFINIFRDLKEIQPKTPIVVILEDIDAILVHQNESDVLNILDGAEGVDKTLFIATTNYPEKLGERIVNRPSRFDRRYKIPLPNAECRQFYINHLIDTSLDQGHVEIDVERWVKDTDAMTISHIKELFVAVAILGYEYAETISILKTMREEKLTSDDDYPKDPYGFQHR